MTKTTIAIAATLTILITGPAMAQNAGGLVRADANRDGQVSKAEAMEARAKMFTRLDRDGDNQISDAEIEAARSRIAAFARMADSAMFLRTQRLDSNGDSVLSRDEFMASSPMFDRVDRNGDGVVSAEEIAEVRARFGRVTR